MQLDKKIIVVGGGYWGKNHIRTLYEMNALGGIVDSNYKILKKFKEKYDFIPMFENISDAFREDHIGGFVVATPAETHYEIAIKIINAGFHVLVEKPVTLDKNEVLDLKHASELNNVNLMAGHVLLFHPAIQKIKSLLIENVIGDLQYLYSNRLNFGTVRSNENVFWSLAPHDVSIFQYLTNLKPKKIISKGGTFLQKNIHDTTVTILEYEKNIKGHIFVSWLHPFKEHRLVVIGSNGMITYEDSSENKYLKLYDKSFDLAGKSPKKNDGGIELIAYDDKKPLNEELKYFLNHLDGTPIKIANAQNAVDVIDILIKSSESLEKEIAIE